MSDLHLGSGRFGGPEGGANSRATEAVDVLGWFVDLVETEHADLAVWCGDTFDSRHPSPRDLRTIAEAARGVADVCPLVVIGGNHDGPTTVGDAATHTLGWLEAVRMPGVVVATEPGVALVDTAAGVVRVVAQPYPHPRSLDGRERGSVGERQAAVSRAAEAWAREQAKGSLPSIYVGHLSVAGASLGAERTMRAGWDVTIPVDALAGYDLALLGHLHARQRLSPNAWYCGSPMRWDWSEEGQSKGGLVADVERGRAPLVRTVDYPARPIRTVDLAYSAGTPFAWPEWGESLRDAMTRVRVDADRRPEAAWRARLEREAYAAGAHFVRVDVTVREAERRREGPTARVGSEERLRAWLAARGGADEALLALAREITGGAE